MMKELILIRAELLKWEEELIGFKSITLGQSHIMNSEIKELEIELGAVRTFIAKIDKVIKNKRTQAV